MRSQTQFASPAESRRGVILLIVITLLALFAAVGLSFLYYAEAEAASSNTFRQATDLSRPDVEPELALSYFLGKLIYGEVDDEAGVYNAGRGHDLARGIYGGDYQFQVINGTKMVVMGANQRSYAGTGRLHYYYPAGVLAGQDDYSLINYQYFPSDGFLRDPERLAILANSTPSFRASPSAQLNPFTGGFNASWTYPDLNSFYLAAVLADGTVLTPSFHREYLFGQLNNPANPNWTNAAGKYLTLRPRPNEHPGFPMPEGRGGDVQNLPWGPGGNDSIWIDFGAPVMISEDGRKYKMVFAALIIDLDGRVNLNVHGNIKGAANTYAGNQGWGRWEVNLNQVLPTTAEVPQVFRGRTNPTVTGRYGANRLPSGTITATPPIGPWYVPVDFDGINSGPLVLPTAGTTRTSTFPTYPAGYNNSNAAELTNHPSMYNYWLMQGDDRIFPLTNQEALMRLNDKGSPALTSELFQLLSQNFQASARARNLVTLQSMDLRLPGLAPWVWDPTAAQYTFLANAATATNPTGSAIPFQSLKNRSTTSPPANSEYAPNWSGIPAVLNRLDLNRALPDYPVAGANGVITNNVAFTAAQAARQQFAKDIYNLLIRVTGAQDPNQVTLASASGGYGAARWLAQLSVNIVDYIDNDDYMTPFNWFAGKPATPNAAAQPAEWVFGTEIPRLVINEAYISYDNDGTDPRLPPNIAASANASASLPYRLNVWVELLNTFRPTPTTGTNINYPRDGGSAILQNSANPNPPPYILQVCQSTALAPLSNAANATGDPTFSTTATPVNSVLSTVNNWLPGPSGTPTIQQVLPTTADQYAPGVPATTAPTGFFVAGPQTTFLAATATTTNRTPNLPTSFTTPLLSMPFPNTTPPVATAAPANPVLVLRRLACEHMPLQTDPTQPFYNPYITVDYTESMPVNDSRLYNPTLIAPAPPAVVTYASVGRRQPYAGIVSQRVAQAPNPAKTGQQPQNTFRRHNGVENAAPPSTTTAGQTLQIPFTWLVQLDRPLISPMELLHVSAFRPHQLTHQFVNAAGTPFGHYAPWLDNGTGTLANRARIYRFFEYVKTGDLTVGMDNIARVPGQININTIWEPEVLSALCGDSTNGVALYRQLMALRTPNFLTLNPNYATTAAVASSNQVIGPTDTQTNVAPAGFGLDRPIGSLATGYSVADVPSAANSLGQTPSIRGAQNTILQAATLNGNASTQSLFNPVAGGHPYVRHQMLTKLFNNLTTRSNSFAVFVTVGFFQVTNDAVRPVQLGAEIGRAENRHVRHRFFAIVDRSDLRRSSFGITPNSGTQMVAGNQQQVTVNAPLLLGAIQGQMVMSSASGQGFMVSVGDSLVLEPNTPNEEVVPITAASPGQFTFTPLRNHPLVAPATPPSIPAAFRGNPGPWLNYNPRLDTGVVRYFSVID